MTGVPPTAIPDVLTPLDVAARWPVERPLVMLHSGRPHPRWSRRTVLAAPAAVFRHDGRRSTFEVLDHRWTATTPDFTDDPLADLQTLVDLGASTHPSRAPFESGWIGALSYDLGRRLEPAATSSGGAIDDRDWPLVSFAFCPDPFVYDHDRAAWRTTPTLPLRSGPPDAPPSVGRLASTSTPEAHRGAVARAIEYIAAGDIFQANITQRVSATFAGSTRDLMAAAMRRARPWYAAYLECPDGRTLLSLSPELFLEVDGSTRTVVTRPIKGTRPSSIDPAELLASAKDAAELTMIIDLMRNDLGRVCRVGSVRVTEARRLESHPTVHHTVGEVVGTLRPDVDLAALLRATFPGGSVTGAPKIRAMQIIDELEPVRRGPYCGSIGWVGTDGTIALNIAIRTVALSGARSPGRFDALVGRLDYGAGGGIVADSRPDAEYRESLDKIAVLQAILADLGADSAVHPVA
ncbi:MAG: anthranilate synthase component I family protein [Phycisphaerales bacterium]|nr:anthranilate synthase component I family protein [Phycisphaerales bacterium]